MSNRRSLGLVLVTVAALGCHWAPGTHTTAPPVVHNTTNHEVRGLDDFLQRIEIATNDM